MVLSSLVRLDGWLASGAGEGGFSSFDIAGPFKLTIKKFEERPDSGKMCRWCQQFQARVSIFFEENLGRSVELEQKRREFQFCSHGQCEHNRQIQEKSAGFDPLTRQVSPSRGPIGSRPHVPSVEACGASPDTGECQVW